MKVAERSAAWPPSPAMPPRNGRKTRSTYRRRGGALALAALLVLPACTGPDSTPDDIVLPSDEPTAPAGSPTPSDPVTGGPAPSPDPSATAEPTAGGEWGAYSSQAEACTAVAADVVAVAFLPVSLGFGADAENIGNAETEIERIKDAAPWALVPDFARLQLIVDDYGEETESSDDASFDGEAFEEALEPIQEWLTENCEDPEGEEEQGAGEESAPQESTRQETAGPESAGQDEP